MSIEVSCRSCAGRFRVPDNASGKKIRCPKCKELISVPSVAAPQAASAAEKTVSVSAEATAPAPAKKQPPEAWYLKTEEEETFGPVPRGELDAWYAEGRISAECQLLREGSEQWQWAADLYPELDEPAAAPSPNEAAAVSDEPVEPNGSTIISDDPLGLNLQTPAPAAGKSSIKTTSGAKSTQDKKQASHKAAPPLGDDGHSSEVSDRSKTTAALLALFLGSLGIHRFYLGYTLLGVVQLLLCGGLGVWQLVDFVLILTGKLPDIHGRPLA
jgi:predicted Zn finger-like uncharacterized protein